VKIAPAPRELAARQLPPCALTTASTIARPRPAPPWARERATSARAKRSKIRSLAPAGSPWTLVGEVDLEHSAQEPLDLDV
jgi:hypothetical protein